MSKKITENKKTTTTLLIVLVVLIWGVFFIKMFRFSDSENTMNYGVSSPIEKISLKEKVKVGKVKLTYRDPFGMVFIKKKKKVRIVKKKTKIVKKKVIFPTISYNGFIGTQQNIKFYIATIRGRQHYLKLFQEIDKLKLIEGDAKKIVFSKENELKSISLNK